MAFTAEYLSGEICVQEAEIEDARWFDIDGLPEISSEVSIAGRLIRHVVNEFG
ncbi:MAG: hypothetical protein VX737_03255 [Pseudomonadota bacterium]|nr:hypothetical protein [Pseudomonadota bacterium]